MKKPQGCKNCGREGGMIWHGKYPRGLKTMENRYEIVIRRILCKECGKTFGVLPKFVEKFRRYARDIIRFVMRCLKKKETYEGIAGRFSVSLIGVTTLRQWRLSSAEGG